MYRFVSLFPEVVHATHDRSPDSSILRYDAHVCCYRFRRYAHGLDSREDRRQSVPSRYLVDNAISSTTR